MPTKRNKEYGHAYGNSARHLVRRLKRDAPEVCKDLAAGKYPSARAACIAAGIIRPVAPEDVRLERLLAAWVGADLEDRQLFLGLVDDEIDAAREGLLLRSLPRRQGMAPYDPAEGAAIPEVERALERGATVASLARKLGIPRRTLQRWRRGVCKPSGRLLKRLRDLSDSESEGGA
jgi:hypothetical protein